MEEIHARFRHLVYRIIYSIVQESGASEESSQETFLRIWRRIDSFDEEKGTFEKWIAAIARNQARDYLRSLKGTKNLPFGPGMEEDSILRVESHAAQIELRNLILTLAEKLTAAQREVMELVYFQ